MAEIILIVEDNELNMKLENDLLQAHGYDTLQSPDGKDTIQLAREYHLDLIVMDIHLPEISGMEYTQMLKADDELKDIPVLAVTAFAMKGEGSKTTKARPVGSAMSVGITRCRALVCASRRLTTNPSCCRTASTAQRD